jgi:hypothetical protein
MSTQLPFPLPVATYGRATQRPARETLKIVAVGALGIVALGMLFSALEPKKVHPTFRRVR